MKAVLELAGISKSYNGVPALHPNDMTVSSGDVIVLIGASGSGKSTLLRCSNMLAVPDTGTVTLEGVALDPKGARPRASRRQAASLARQRIRMGMVFQSFNLFEHLSAMENIALSPRKVLKVDKTEANDHALKLLGVFVAVPPAATPSSFSRTSDWRNTPTSGRRKCREVNSNVSLLHGPSPLSRASCCSMNRHPRLIHVSHKRYSERSALSRATE